MPPSLVGLKVLEPPTLYGHDLHTYLVTYTEIHFCTGEGREGGGGGSLCCFVIKFTHISLSYLRLLLDLDKIFSQLRSDIELLSKFEKEWEELNVWLSDNKSMMEVSTYSSPSGVGVAASPARLRGKHQVREVLLYTNTSIVLCQ